MFETLASCGDANLGGSDFDNRLMEYCLDNFCENNKKNKFDKKEIKKNIKCKQRLKMACERSKEFLSIKTEETVFIEDFYQGEDLNCKISRSKFEEICNEEFKRLIPPLKQVLSDKNMKKENLSEIILVGGSSKIPKIKEILKEEFPDITINDSINPEEAVAYGATIFSEAERRKTGDFWEDFDYMDSIQHSYGIEIDNGEMDFIIRKGSKYPTSNYKYFFTAENNQKNFEIKIYEGENKYVKNNIFLDKFIIEGIPRKKKGEVCLTLTFSIDKNQILNVTGSVAEGNIKKNIEVKKSNQRYTINTLIASNVSNEISKKERQIKDEIDEYSKKFVEAKNDKDKLQLINKYNEAILFLLNYLENQDLDVFYKFVQRLFQSYAFVINSEIIKLMTKEQKKSMDEKITFYLEKTSEKNPFRVKDLLIYFKPIDINKSKIYYINSIVFMGYLCKYASTKYKNLDEKSHAFNAKNIYEECLSIANENLYLNDKKKNDFILNNLDIKYKIEFKNLVEKCKEQIFFLSTNFLEGIEYTKVKGKLFSNDDKLDYENLSLMSENISKSLKEMENIKEIENNKKNLELGSIRYANLVKIELLKEKEKNKLNLNKLLNYANKSIKMAENIEDDKRNSEWYTEIVNLKNGIENKLSELKTNQINNSEKIREKFKNISENGNEELVKYLLKNYPCEGCQYSEEKMQEFRANEKIFLKKLKKDYNKATKFLINSNEDENNINENFKDIKFIIQEYINNMINKIQ